LKPPQSADLPLVDLSSTTLSSLHHHTPFKAATLERQPSSARTTVPTPHRSVGCHAARAAIHWRPPRRISSTQAVVPMPHQSASPPLPGPPSPRCAGVSVLLLPGPLFQCCAEAQRHPCCLSGGRHCPNHHHHLKGWSGGCLPHYLSERRPPPPLPRRPPSFFKVQEICTYIFITRLIVDCGGL
jgi:hypothetical protein